MLNYTRITLIFEEKGVNLRRKSNTEICPHDTCLRSGRK